MNKVNILVIFCLVFGITLNFLQKNKALFLGIQHNEWARFEQSMLPVAETNWIGKSILGNLKF